MSNICGYTIKWAGTGRRIQDPKEITRLEFDDGVTVGTRKHGPPLEILQTMKASCILEWEEHALSGLGIYILIEGEVIKEITTKK